MLDPPNDVFSASLTIETASDCTFVDRLRLSSHAFDFQFYDFRQSKKYGRISLIVSLISFVCFTEAQKTWHREQETVLLYRVLVCLTGLPYGVVWICRTKSHEQAGLGQKPLYYRLIFPGFFLACLSTFSFTGYSFALSLGGSEFILSTFMSQPIVVFLLTFIFEDLSSYTGLSFILTLGSLALFLFSLDDFGKPFWFAFGSAFSFGIWQYYMPKVIQQHFFCPHKDMFLMVCYICVFELLLLFPFLIYAEIFQNYLISFDHRDYTAIVLTLICNHLFLFGAIFSLVCLHPIVFSEMLLTTVPVLYVIYLCRGQVFNLISLLALILLIFSQVAVIISLKYQPRKRHVSYSRQHDHLISPVTLK